MIFVIGATGTVGQHVVNGLRSSDRQVRALVRPASEHHAYTLFASASDRVELVAGSADDRTALDAALIDVDSVFLAMRNTPEQERIERMVIDACAHANVATLVKVSAPHVEPDVPVAVARMHGRIEAYALERSLSCTFLRPFGFMQNLIGLAAQIARTGTFIGAAGTAAFNFVDARDIAEVAVRRLIEPTNGYEALVLTGPESISQHELADRMRHHGIEAHYVDLPPAAFEKALTGAGLPPWLVTHLTELQRLAVMRPQTPNTTIERITGRRARTIDSFLGEHAHHYAAEPTSTA
jgi:uncharacterized protein YbjT (DUF2867 family)